MNTIPLVFPISKLRLWIHGVGSEFFPKIRDFQDKLWNLCWAWLWERILVERKRRRVFISFYFFFFCFFFKI